MTSLMEVLFSEGTFGDTGPCIPPIRFFRCLCLFLSTYHHTYMQPLIYFEALPLSWSLAADWQIDLFHPVCSIKSGPMYVVLNILRMQNQSKRGGCENCDAWNRFVFPSENAGKPQTPTAVRTDTREASHIRSSRVSEICSSSKQVSQVRLMF